ncbi:hypothetical protein IJ531_05940 [bacterium]|nr:hypothetical protein [bacterium]
MKFLRIFFIFLYFALCFILKGDFENYLSYNTEISYNQKNTQIVQNTIPKGDIVQYNFNCEVSNIQNNNRNNSLFGIKKIILISINNARGINQKHFSNRNLLAFNPEHIIYQRAP